MPKFPGDKSECNHDVERDDATAHAYTLGCEWGTETTVFCHVCMEQIGPSILECGMCGASWQECLFNGCPWCNGFMGAGERGQLPPQGKGVTSWPLTP